MSSMSRVNSLLWRFRKERTALMKASYDKQVIALAKRFARRLRAEQGADLSPGQKGAITRKAWVEAERQAKLDLKDRRVQLDLEIEVERQRLIMLHCPPDTPEGRAAKVANEERRAIEEAQREAARVESELQRIKIAAEKSAAIAQRQADIAQRKAERQAAADRRLADILAHREANPPPRRFNAGEEPAGWKPHMERGGLDRHWLEGVAEKDDVTDPEAVAEPEVHPLTLALGKKRGGSPH